MTITLHLQKAGIKVLAISDDIYNSLFNIAQIHFGTSHQIIEQLFSLNSLVVWLTKKTHPDIIIVRPPFPIMQFDDDTPFDCGVSAYMISKAIPGDCGILCSPAGYADPVFWERIIDTTQVKLGYPINFVQISNQIVDKALGAPASFIRVPIDNTLQEVNELNKLDTPTFYSIEDCEKVEMLFEHIKSEYINVEFEVI